MRLLKWFRFKPRIIFVPFLVIGMVTSNIEVPTTGIDFGAVFLLGGLTCGAGVGLWQISKGRRRGEYQLPRWLDEIDSE